MRFSPTLLSVASVLMLVSAAYAADSAIAPLPAPALDHISSQDSDTSGIMTTKKPTDAATAAPAATPTAVLPWGTPAQAPATAPAANASGAAYQPKIPFGHADAPAPIIPSGPHETIAVPVVNVQSLEAPEAAPPTPADPQADPSKDDPAEPTELTSPLFGESDNPSAPRKIILRLLNKVTAQSSLLTLKPNESVHVGQLDITAITCQTSLPQSQTDYAGFVDIVERSQTANTVKPLFRGWMYASSPSITALEHPVYDVTMVECQMAQPEKAVKEDEKPAKKAKK